MLQSIIFFFHITKEIISIFEKIKDQCDHILYKQSLTSNFKLFLMIAANTFTMIFKILKDSDKFYVVNWSSQTFTSRKSLLAYDEYYLQI
jgi:hypothetical protein